MSLIIDAIQKAQQLRLKEVKAKAPFFFRKPGPPGKREGGPRKWIWIAGGAFGVISFLLFLLVGRSLPLFASHQKEKIPPAVEKTLEKEARVQEPPKNNIIPTSQVPEHPSVMAMLEDKRQDETLKQPGVKKSRKLPTLRPEDEDSQNPRVGRPGSRSQQPLLTPSRHTGLQAAEGTKKTSKKKKAVAERELTLAPSEAEARKVSSLKAPPEEEKKEMERGRAMDILTSFNLGVSHYHQREVLKAIEAYQRVIEMDPTYVEAYNNLGVLYQDIGDFNKSLEAYRKAIAVNPRYEKGYNNLGILLYLKGNHREAIDAFEKAIGLNGKNIESYINLGILFKKEGQVEKAVDCYRKALEINPMHGEAHYNIGLLYEQLENFEFAIGHYQQFTRLASKTHPDLVLRVQRHLNNLVATKGK